MDVSIIIVNYNTKDLLQNCIKSIIEQTKDIEYEIIVSDNGSQDGSINMIKSDYPQVRLIENNANIGFGAANNQGLSIAKGKYVFYLNSDTILLNNAVKIFFDYWENSIEKEQIGALGGMLLNENKQYIHSFGKFPTGRKVIKDNFRLLIVLSIKSILNIFGFNPKKHIIQTEDKYIGNVEYITGADLFMKNNFDAKFDENIFLYNEDTEINKRLELNNKKRLIIDNIEIIHLTGGSNSLKDSLNHYYSFSHFEANISMIYYLKKFAIKKSYIWIFKFLVIIMYLNPFFIKRSFKQIKRIINK